MPPVPGSWLSRQVFQLNQVRPNLFGPILQGVVPARVHEVLEPGVRYRVDVEKNLLLVRGAVPGATGATVVVRKSKGAPAAKA